MGKKIIISLIFVILLLFCSCESKTHGVYKVNITAELLINNSVGNEWEHNYTYNGQKIHNGFETTKRLEDNDCITILITVIENDRYPDISQDYITVNIQSGETTTKCITVYENKGAFKGNYAIWKYTVSCECVRKF